MVEEIQALVLQLEQTVWQIQVKVVEEDPPHPSNHHSLVAS